MKLGNSITIIHRATEQQDTTIESAYGSPDGGKGAKGSSSLSWARDDKAFINLTNPRKRVLARQMNMMPNTTTIDPAVESLPPFFDNKRNPAH